MIVEHADHEWEQVDAYVHCRDCKCLLYEGVLPWFPVNQRRVAELLDKTLAS